MGKIKLRYTLTAAKIIRHLSPSIKPAIRTEIETLIDNPLRGKALRNELAGFRSLRFKYYRIIYQYDDVKQVVDIHFAGSRTDVYLLFGNMMKRKS